MKNSRSIQRSRSAIERAAMIPYSTWAVLFIVVPLFFVAYYAFTDNQMNFTLDNITKFFTATSTVTDDTA